MSSIPEGAQLSEDGMWWWDGAEWQPVQGQADYSQADYSETTDEGETADNGVLYLDPSDYPTIFTLIEAGELDNWLMTIGFPSDDAEVNA